MTKLSSAINEALGNDPSLILRMPASPAAERTYNPDKAGSSKHSIISAWNGGDFVVPDTNPECSYHRGLKNSGLPPYLGGRKQGGPLPPARG